MDSTDTHSSSCSDSSSFDFLWKYINIFTSSGKSYCRRYHIGCSTSRWQPPASKCSIRSMVTTTLSRLGINRQDHGLPWLQRLSTALSLARASPVARNAASEPSIPILSTVNGTTVPVKNYNIEPVTSLFILPNWKDWYTSRVVVVYYLVRVIIRHSGGSRNDL